MKSSVEHLDHMGTDLDVVNAARVSFDKESEGVRVREPHDGYTLERTVPTEQDVKLLHYLARGMSGADLDEMVRLIVDAGRDDVRYGPDPSEVREQLRKYRARPLHWSPFAHVILQVRITAPIAIARQLETHQVGLAANEVSRRYVDTEPEFLTVDTWRSRPTDRKQGSGRPLSAIHDGAVHGAYKLHCDASFRLYRALLSDGVAPEQARFVLPQSMMTTWIWTGSLYAFSSICRQRVDDDHAQAEVRDVCEPLAAICAEHFPESWRALRSY
jgi:thymidylate synthase (FAD)